MRAGLPAALGAALAFAAPTRAQTVHPATATVPANLLRISVEFDRPQPAVVGEGIALEGPDGRPIDGAIYPQRLWSPDRRTLTVYLDPGRVKTGLMLRDAVGAILSPGQRVRLSLGGRTLRTWTVAAANERPLEPALGALRAPRAGTRETLTLGFATPIDWQGRELIAVAGPDGGRVAGAATLADGERTWRFTPDAPWRAGRYALRLHPDLEDAEGNRVGRPFETRPGAAAARETTLAFEVRRSAIPRARTVGSRASAPARREGR